MHYRFFEKLNQKFTWKKIAVLNGVLLFTTLLPVSVDLIGEKTKTTPQAVVINNVAPTTTPRPVSLQGAPIIDRILPFYGKVGDVVVLLGANFGASQQKSVVSIGDVVVPKKNITRWGPSVIEVVIPAGTKSGKVQVEISRKKSVWEGTLMVYIPKKAAQVGLAKKDAKTITAWVNQSTGAARAIIEIGHTGKLQIDPLGGRIVSQTQTSDKIGNKTKLEVAFKAPLSAIKTDILRLMYPGSGKIELLRVELYKKNNTLLPVYAERSNYKVL